MAHPAEPPERPLARPAPVLVLVATALAAVAVLVVFMRRDPGMAAHIAEDYMDVAGGLVAPVVTTSDAAQLSSALSQRLGARVAVPSLSPAGFVLAGGGVHEAGSRVVAYAIYHDALLDLVVWHGFAGTPAALPASGEPRLLDGRQFWVQQKATNTLVAWQAGPILSVLTSSLPAERVVQLAAVASKP